MERQEPPNIGKLAFSYDEAVTATGLSRSTLKRLVGEGKLRAIAIGRRRVIPKADLERLVNAEPTP